MDFSIEKVFESCRIHTTSSNSHITHPQLQHTTTPHHTTTAATLAWLLSLLLLLAASQRGISISLPVTVTSAHQHPMSAVRGIDDLLPAAALAVALAALEEVKRQDLNDDMDENSPRVKLTRCPRKRRDSGTCGWAQLLKDKDLSDSTSITAKQFRTDFRLPYPFFLELVKLVKRKKWFPTADKDACGRRAHPVEHKVSIADDRPLTRDLGGGSRGGLVAVL